MNDVGIYLLHSSIITLKRNNLKWLIQSVENYKVFESFDAPIKFIFFDANKLIILLFQVELL